MNHLIHVLSSTTKMTFKAILVAVILLVNPFFIRAHESGMRINYRCNSAVVEAGYQSNSQTLAQFDSEFRSGDVAAFEIVAYASPEGNTRYNEALASRRANALRTYLHTKYPHLNGKINVRPSGEAWDVLRDMVESDNSLSEGSRSRILDIISSDSDNDTKESSLKALPDYRFIYDNYFSLLRFAEIHIISHEEYNASSASGAAFYELRSTTIYFPLRGTELDADFSRNTDALEAIRQLLAGRDPEEVTGISITSYTSPEGPVAINNRYAASRGEALKQYIVRAYPALSGKVSVHSAGEAWEDLSIAVDSDVCLSEASRSSILSIIVSNSAADAKEAKLRSLPEWNHLFEDVFPGLRCATLKAEFGEKPADVTVITPEEVELPEPEVEDESLAVTDSTLVLQDTTLFVPKAAVPAPDFGKPLFAVSTNVVYDLGGLIRPLSWTPNFAIEIPIGRKWSTFGEYTFPWWVTPGNDQAWQILKWDIGARRWLSRTNANDKWDILRGHFIGIDLGAGYYDIEPSHRGWQGEFQTVGLEYGYAWKLARNWRLDAYVGGGWMGTHYRYYQGSSNDEHLIYNHHGKMTWYGPTKAGISIKYIFKSTDRRAEQ